jgi:hypothetical protein
MAKKVTLELDLQQVQILRGLVVREYQRRRLWYEAKSSRKYRLGRVAGPLLDARNKFDG